MKATKEIILEPTTEAFIDSLKGAPPIYTLTPSKARQVLEDVQSKFRVKHPVEKEDLVLPVGPAGETSVRIYRSKAGKKAPVIMHFHGGGWILGTAATHERLVCDIVHATEANVVFVNYSRSPEARFPTAIEEAFAATKFIADEGRDLNLEPSHLCLMGDSVGGNMAIAVALLAKRRGGPKCDCLCLYYPVTDASLDTMSYSEFYDGPWLTKKAMQWFWDAYEPDPRARNNVLQSPLHAPVQEFKSFPRSLIINGENDVLRDEGEQFAHKLMQAKVPVTACRFAGTIHDFMLLNPLAETPAVKGALALTKSFLADCFKSKP